MAAFNLTESVRKAFLAGVGAVATGAEKSAALIDELVKKGELTVEQGKELNSELTRKAREAAGTAEEAALKAKLKNMTAEQRAAWIAKVSKLADDFDAEPIEVEVEEAAATDTDSEDEE